MAIFWQWVLVVTSQRLPRAFGPRNDRVGDLHRSSYIVIARRYPKDADVGRKGELPVAEPSDRGGWAGACVCTSNAQGKCLAPTRKSFGSRFLSILP